MFDRYFSAALAFAVLAAGTMAVALAMLEEPAQVVQLPRVEVTGKRVAAAVETIAQCDTPAPGAAATAMR
jgi:hypothetical protein